jgi:hypothetical protein
LGASEVDEIKSPIYATGVGLVLKGFKELEEMEKINAIPNPKEREKAKEEVKQANILSRLYNQGKKWLIEEDDLNDF